MLHSSSAKAMQYLVAISIQQPTLNLLATPRAIGGVFSKSEFKPLGPQSSTNFEQTLEQKMVARLPFPNIFGHDCTRAAQVELLRYACEQSWGGPGMKAQLLHNSSTTCEEAIDFPILILH
jgi:hypothetical protein